MRIPKLPAYPTAPMSGPSLALLLAALQDLRPHMKMPMVKVAVREIYIRVWIHAALQLGHTPTAIRPKTQRFVDVATLFSAILLPSGLASRFDLQMHWAPEIHDEAGQCWDAAKRDQVAWQTFTEAPILDLAEGTHG